MEQVLKNKKVFSNKKSELGQGLQDLLSNVIGIDSNDEPLQEKETTSLKIGKIFPNAGQPRTNFKPDEMANMIESIKENGILQPILVRPVDDGFEIVAGERRWRAAKELGLEEIPVVIRMMTDEKAMELALVENLQREDLNPIEKALAYKNLLQNYNLTQDQVAQRLSIDRSSVANFVRLLDLTKEVQQSVSRGTVSMGHARALLAVKSEALQQKFCSRIERESLSVRQIESIVSDYKIAKPSLSNSPAKEKKHSVIADLEDRLRLALKTKVSLDEKGGKGKLQIEFYSNEQLANILSLLGVPISN